MSDPGEVQCKKCGSIVCIDGDVDDRFMAYCDVCKDYAAGFDAEEYRGEQLAGAADALWNDLKDRAMLGDRKAQETLDRIRRTR